MQNGEVQGKVTCLTSKQTELAAVDVTLYTCIRADREPKFRVDRTQISVGLGTNFGLTGLKFRVDWAQISGGFGSNFSLGTDHPDIFYEFPHSL
jgi:hypothetical protein